MARDEPDNLPHVVVLGAGFGGLQFCQRFRGRARVTLIDRTNHHLFQPLLYQVATAGLSAADIAAPIRGVLSRQRHVRVVMDEVQAIDLDARQVRCRDATFDYDYLVIAIGGVTWYFGNEDWAENAPGLKTLDDALAVRKHVLTAFEWAETTDDPETRRKLTTIVIVGAGPTGVELAGAFAELTHRVFKRDFRQIDPTTTRVVLIEATPRVLPMFPPELSEKAQRQLESLNVEVWTDAPAERITRDRVETGDGRSIEAGSIFWGGGVVAHPIVQNLGVELEKGFRIKVEPDLSLPGHPEAFAIGDVAAVLDDEGNPVPGLAPAAMQMGRHVARVIEGELAPGSQTADRPRSPADRPRFHYRNKGMMATIGRKRAVAWLGRLRFGGFLAWLMWLFVHLLFLVGFRNKVSVLLQWFYAYVTFRHGARIVFGTDPQPPTQPTPPPKQP